LEFVSHLSVYRLATKFLSGHILDAGCGTGYRTAYLVDHGTESARLVWTIRLWQSTFAIRISVGVKSNSPSLI
jgi:SAM-dependent methyltransferase